MAKAKAEPPPNVHLDLVGTAENVVLVREMLSGLAEAINLDSSILNDIRTAVTEACNNVVLHAYEGREGPLHVEVHLERERLTVLVRDYGSGLETSHGATPTRTEGIGLHVIKTLSRRVEFTEASEGGTEVRMQFATPGTGAFEPLLGSITQLSPVPGSANDSAASTTVSIAPIMLARTVLPRIVSTMAARAHFSTDRISDAQLLTDAVVAHARDAIASSHLSVDLSVVPRDLELRVAPLQEGSAERLLRGESGPEDVGGVIQKLADRHEVDRADRYETLILGLIDRR